MRKSLQLVTLTALLLAACGEPSTPNAAATLTGDSSALESRLSALEDKIKSLEETASAAPTAPATTESSNNGQSLKVQPSAITIGSGASKDIELLTLVKSDGSNVVLTDFSSANFSSSDTATMTVTATGKVTGVKDGGAVLTVRLGELSTQVPVIVSGSAPAATPTPETSPTPSASPSAEASASPEPSASPSASNDIESVGLGPITMELEEGQSASISSVAITFKDGNIGLLNDKSKVTWSSSNEEIAIVSSAGAVTARKEGTATITGTYEGVSGTMTVTVIPAP